MKYLRFISIILIIFFVNSLWAGTTGKITGQVKDARSGEPLPGVNVVVEGTALGASTDLEGYYVITNIPPGMYSLTFSMVGYAAHKVTGVRVNIDQTTVINAKLQEQVLEGEEIVVVATRPVVEKDVAASRANISSEEIKAIPVVNVSSVVGLQAGIEGLSIRGGGLSEVAFVMDGITLRNERDNSPFTGISLTAVEEMQVQAGGFSAEYGNIRSGVVNVVTKEGKKDRYSVAFLGRYRAPAPKHFGHSPNSPESYWIRPYVDDAVCWTGTRNGNWDYYTQRQYPEFKGWNQISFETLQNDDPNDDLTPEAAQQVFLFQHRRQLDIQIPDYVGDFSFGGPVPVISKDLGNLRFYSSFRKTQDAYLIPLQDDAYRTWTFQTKVTSDVGSGKKLMFSGLLGRETGVDRFRDGTPGMFTASWQIGRELSNGPKYIDARMFATDYWGPARTDYKNLGVKWTHALDEKTFYEASFSIFRSEYHKGIGRYRDRTKKYLFGNNYYIDEGPFGFEPMSVAGINGMRMGAGFSNARDSSKVTTYSLNLDYTKQINRFNNIKVGGEFVLTHSQVNYGRYDEFLPSANTQTKWDRKPVRGALYIQDKLEFEGMIATIGVRMDYFHAGGEWYDLESNPYNPAINLLVDENVSGLDSLLPSKPTKHLFTFSPRLAIAFPVTENSKLYFNYGHFRQLPQPEDLFVLRENSFLNQITRVGNPNSELQKTVAYELGYEHNILNQFLVRAAGYYKDITLQPTLVLYENLDGSVSYYRQEPNNYEDIRGFEITINKNRGRWVRGFVNYTYMVSTYGYFGYGRYYENPAQQRQYEVTTSFYYQTKPKPRPYARANLDFFTPQEFGPKIVGFQPLSDININILANWKAGRYETWAGGGNIPGLFANVQWVDYLNFDLRIRKNFRIKNFGNLEFFVDISNVFNYKYMTDYGFVDGQDKRDYMKSLHLPASTEGVDQFGYYNIPGNDKPGVYRRPGIKFVPIEVYDSMDFLPQEGNPNYLYYTKDGGQYYKYDAEQGAYVQDKKYTDWVLNNKAYIDMPNQQYLTFLNPRDVFFGIRFSFEL
ncbi:TonB-dependent receptor [Caldithrix abyssi DSM 13497]|uniref:TonB-dependent receptor n=1 Tax=Caldithrix abyssi DSM 13497 TaxID=880073 RepID=H1XQN3_CALAY|nr:carboxypeptidase-like regulatory domain-containing protein [Caldithrix abyssi]APF17028.1 TonB-dependent Receptor Plug Domain [Caldithrix abyssi DSM 13497]EHO41179.1 TonB-dependent receptor [Caldithrix abyssi DSM 13497]